MQKSVELVETTGRGLEELARAGRLASVLCRLSRMRFSGVVYVEHEDGGRVFTFRDGMPIYVEDLGNAPPLGDELLARGLITAQQYAEIASAALGSATENEDLAFCEQAVALRVLTHAQVDRELERRLRARLIQAIGLRDCRIEIDSDPEMVAAVQAYPLDLGPLVHTGVRTFFDEEAIEQTLGATDQLYLRLYVAARDAVQFFDLEADDEALLARLEPTVPLSQTIEACAGDPLDAWQLIALLVMAEFGEVGRAPFSPLSDRSGVRSTQALAAAGDGDGNAPGNEAANGSRPRMPAVREEVVSRPRMPAVREEVASGSRADMPGARGEAACGSQPRMPAVHEDVVPGGSRPRVAAAPADMLSGPRAQTPAVRPGDAHASQPRRGPEAEIKRAPSPGAAAYVQGSPKPQPSAAQARPPADELGSRRGPRRKLGAALQRLDRELKENPALRSGPGFAAPAHAGTGRHPAHAAGAGQHAAVRPNGSGQLEGAQGAESGQYPSAHSAGPGQHAHVEQLLRMRVQAMVQKRSDSEGGAGATESARLAQDAMRENQFARAHELWMRASEEQPDNADHMLQISYAALRAGMLDEEGITKLRATLRELISDDQRRKFAYYALGHLALIEKKDDAAEKFFRKAIELDKTNKDAERHLRIIELRRKTAAEEQRSGKIFGIEITRKKS